MVGGHATTFKPQESPEGKVKAKREIISGKHCKISNLFWQEVEKKVLLFFRRNFSTKKQGQGFKISCQ